MSEDKKIRHHMKSIKERANAPKKRSKSSQIEVNNDKEPRERDGNASEGHDPTNQEEDFAVPEGRRKKRLQQYCRKFCKVDLVVE